MLQRLKNRLRLKTYERAISYALQEATRNITHSLRPTAYAYNTFCFMNVANHVLADEGRVVMYNGRIKPGVYWSSRPTLVLLVDKVTQEAFLHCVAYTHSMAGGMYDEVTYGWYAGRFDYYFIQALEGDLMRIDLLFNNARVDFLDLIGTPFWYRWFITPSELI